MFRQKINTFLWFNGQAEEAAKFYVSVFAKRKGATKKSKIESISSSSTAERQIKLIPSEQKQPPQRPNRCTVCRKRVGLTGFVCRCGTTFCGTHRYPEVHGCTFDFKSAGREEIAKANPLVIAAKLQKI